MGNIKFEAALSRLEALVNSLEKGDLSLEKSLHVFEEGVRLSKNCVQLLNEAEKKVEWLLHDKEGSLTTSPYLPDGRPEDIETSDTALDTALDPVLDTAPDTDGEDANE